jgi:hypothetical protein
MHSNPHQVLTPAITTKILRSLLSIASITLQQTNDLPTFLKAIKFF